jgi:hypothetical protein
MRKLKCPQCEVTRFFVKNELGDNRLVTVNDNYEVVAVHSIDSLVGFDLTVIYCLGCSWKGSPQSLTKGSHKKVHS